MRARGAALGLAVAALLPLRADALQCQGTEVCSVDPPTTAAQALDCMCDATRFFDDAREQILGSSTFDQVLPSSYEQPSKYEEGKLDRALAYALSHRGETEDRLLFEASFRKASAHGMFADDGLLRALSPQSLGSGVPATQVRVEARRRLDSRVCHTGSTPSAQSCIVDRDCSGSQYCQPVRLSGTNSTYGALQEYRRAESPLLAAIETLGIARFHDVEEGEGFCGEVGCGTRLLVRLSAMKARAQEQLAELLWESATAAGNAGTDAPRCQTSGLVCSAHSDCSAAERCGNGTPAQVARIALEQASREATEEAIASEALYGVLVPSNTFESSADLYQRRASLDRVANVEARGLKGATPFGLPADYVPLLSSVQQGLIDCLSSCGTICDTNSNLACMLNLIEGSSYLGLLDQASTEQQQAQASAAEFADSARDAAAHEAALEGQFRSVITQMLGASCTDLGQSCSCDAADAEAGRCVAFQGEVWRVVGLECSKASGPADDPLVCSVVDPGGDIDGELERQLIALRAAEFALAASDAERDRLFEEADFIRSQMIQRRTDIDANCGELVSIYQHQLWDIQDAIDNREKKNALVKTAEAVELGLSIVTGGIQGAQLGSIGGSWGKAIGAVFGGGNAILQKKAQEERRRKQVEFERREHEIQEITQLNLTWARCDADKKLIDIQEEDALFQNLSKIQESNARIEQQQLGMFAAFASVDQLLAEIAEARSRLEEARELDEIWADADFRNPANYRAIALDKQLDAASSFRTAQIVTWMVLRSISYDLALPDAPLPQLFNPIDVQSFSSCQAAQCSLTPGQACATNSDCPGGASDLCVLAGNAGVADSSGSCSQQAVFAARTVDDLKALIRNAVRSLVADNRELGCPGGQCEKLIQLRDLFTDPKAAVRPTLGEVMLARAPAPGTLATLDFGISLQRGLELCPGLPGIDEVCTASGVSHLAPDEDGTGDLSENLWNARATGVRGRVVYDPARHPNQFKCRNPADGETVNTSVFSCLGATGGEVCTHASPPAGQTGCVLDTGAPTACRCLKLLKNGAPEPEISLRQLEPGVVRTSLADVFNTVGDGSADSQLSYRMREGDLPILGQEPPPSLTPFGVESLSLFEDLNGPVEIDIKGVPVASNRWHIRMRSEGLLDDPDFATAFLRSIQDIELQFFYQAFEIQGQ